MIAIIIALALSERKLRKCFNYCFDCVTHVFASRFVSVSMGLITHVMKEYLGYMGRRRDPPCGKTLTIIFE